MVSRLVCLSKLHRSGIAIGCLFKYTPLRLVGCLFKVSSIEVALRLDVCLSELHGSGLIEVVQHVAA